MWKKIGVRKEKKFTQKIEIPCHDNCLPSDTSDHDKSINDLSKCDMYVNC